MALSYTVEQLDREISLAAYEVIVLADNVLGDGAGLRALGTKDDENDDFAMSRHPDFLDVTNLAIWPSIRKVERYVHNQQWADSISIDIALLRLLVERVFSPNVLKGYAAERADAGEGMVSGKLEQGAGEAPLGFFYRGILHYLLELASARLKLDRGERLTMGEVALLVDVKEPTIVTNAHRKNFATVEEDNRRYAEPASVLSWMVKNGYKPTLRDQPNFDHDDASLVEEDDCVFVPVSADGSVFDPSCRYGGRYQIGPKGEEVKHTDYFEALGNLQRMSRPRWRRKNKEGIPGIVTGVDFQRIRRSELVAQLARVASVKDK